MDKNLVILIISILLGVIGFLLKPYFDLPKELRKFSERLTRLETASLMRDIVCDERHEKNNNNKKTKS